MPIIDDFLLSKLEKIHACTCFNPNFHEENFQHKLKLTVMMSTNIILYIHISYLQNKSKQMANDLKISLSHAFCKVTALVWNKHMVS